jgi:hypothetical protein
MPSATTAPPDFKADFVVANPYIDDSDGHGVPQKDDKCRICGVSPYLANASACL